MGEFCLRMNPRKVKDRFANLVKISGNEKDMKCFTIIFLAVLGIASIIFIHDAIFAIRSLLKAIEGKKCGLTKYNYLRWEMPENDIENQLEDEIKVNSLFIAGVVLWILSIAAYPHSLLPFHLIYVGCNVYFFRGMRNRLNDRYSEYYDVFSTKNYGEYSDELVIYGLRIEGTMAKMRKSYSLSFILSVFGSILMLT